MFRAHAFWLRKHTAGLPESAVFARVKVKSHFSKLVVDVSYAKFEPQTQGPQCVEYDMWRSNPLWSWQAESRATLADSGLAVDDREGPTIPLSYPGATCRRKRYRMFSRPRGTVATSSHAYACFGTATALSEGATCEPNRFA
jgi:hypothetical protein